LPQQAIAPRWCRTPAGVCVAAAAPDLSALVACLHHRPGPGWSACL